MLEPKFTVEHLASILNIPSGKTLLRRHLTAHFINLIGKDKQEMKSEVDSGLRLEINTKVKSRKHLFKKGEWLLLHYEVCLNYLSVSEITSTLRDILVFTITSKSTITPLLFHSPQLSESAPTFLYMSLHRSFTQIQD